MGASLGDGALRLGSGAAAQGDWPFGMACSEMEGPCFVASGNEAAFASPPARARSSGSTRAKAFSKSPTRRSARVIEVGGGLARHFGGRAFSAVGTVFKHVQPVRDDE